MSLSSSNMNSTLECTEGTLRLFFETGEQNGNLTSVIGEKFGCQRIIFNEFCHERSDCLSILLNTSLDDRYTSLCEQLSSTCLESDIPKDIMKRVPLFWAVVVMVGTCFLAVVTLILIVNLAFRLRREDGSADNEREEINETKDQSEGDFFSAGEWIARSLVCGNLGSNDHQEVAVRFSLSHCDSTFSFDDSSANDSQEVPPESLPQKDKFSQLRLSV